MDPIPCNDLKVEQSADSESDSVVSSFLGSMPPRSDKASETEPEQSADSEPDSVAPSYLGPMPLRSDRASGSEPEPPEEEGTEPGCCKGDTSPNTFEDDTIPPPPTPLWRMGGVKEQHSRRNVKNKGKGKGGKAESHHNCGTGHGCCKWNK